MTKRNVEINEESCIITSLCDVENIFYRCSGAKNAKPHRARCIHASSLTAWALYLYYLSISLLQYATHSPAANPQTSQKGLPQIWRNSPPLGVGTRHHRAPQRPSRACRQDQRAGSEEESKYKAEGGEE